eukprot:gene2271-3249_t
MSQSLPSIHDRLFAQHTTSSVHKDCRVPEFQADSLDIALDAKYNQHESFLAGKTAVLKQNETEQVKGLAARVEYKTQAVQPKPEVTQVANQTTSQHFGRECAHGDIHSQATNQGFSRKPNGGGFYSY